MILPINKIPMSVRIPQKAKLMNFQVKKSIIKMIKALLNRSNLKLINLCIH